MPIFVPKSGINPYLLHLSSAHNRHANIVILNEQKTPE